MSPTAQPSIHRLRPPPLPLPGHQLLLTYPWPQGDHYLMNQAPRILESSFYHLQSTWGYLLHLGLLRPPHENLSYFENEWSPVWEK
jgi:hypothetical protein